MTWRLGSPATRRWPAGWKLGRESAVVERAVAKAINVFPWDEVEAFTAPLLAEG